MVFPCLAQAVFDDMDGVVELLEPVLQRAVHLCVEDLPRLGVIHVEHQHVPEVLNLIGRR